MKGKKTGGRTKGSKNKRTKEHEEKIAAASDAGVMPLDYMLNILRDEDATADDRKWAAGQAAPYCHPKLSQVDVEGSLTISHEEALEELD